MNVVEIKNISYNYDEFSNNENAIKDISFNIEKGDFLGVIGKTGSGKTTLIQHLNGLLKPTKGEINYNLKDFDIKDLKFRVGLVFQYPDYQLFEETVFEEVCFGLKNKGVDKETMVKLATTALNDVMFDKDKFNYSPFELSGGEKRKVALASVIAMQPEILVLDEPTANLDATSIIALFNLLQDLNKNGTTIIIVSHDMDIVAKYCKNIVIMCNGEVLKKGSVYNVLSDENALFEAGLTTCVRIDLMKKLHKKNNNIDEAKINSQDMILEIKKNLKND